MIREVLKTDRFERYPNPTPSASERKCKKMLSFRIMHNSPVPVFASVRANEHRLTVVIGFKIA